MISEYLIATGIYKMMKDASVYGNVAIRDRDKLASICLIDWFIDYMGSSEDEELKSAISYLSRTGRYTNNLHNNIVE